MNMRLPQHIVEEFKEQFDKEVDVYWNPFMGWLWGKCDEKLLEDFETLTSEQNDIIGKIVNHEAQVFDEFREWADGELQYRKRHPVKREFQNYPESMLDDVI